MLWWRYESRMSVPTKLPFAGCYWAQIFKTELQTFTHQNIKSSDHFSRLSAWCNWGLFSTSSVRQQQDLEWISQACAEWEPNVICGTQFDGDTWAFFAWVDRSARCVDRKSSRTSIIADVLSFLFLPFKDRLHGYMMPDCPRGIQRRFLGKLSNHQRTVSEDFPYTVSFSCSLVFQLFKGLNPRII